MATTEKRIEVSNSRFLGYEMGRITMRSSTRLWRIAFLLSEL
jgi:hypothetical protein